MRRNLFMLTFGLLSGTVGAGCLHDSHNENYRANITSDLGKQRDPVALAKPERSPLEISKTSTKTAAAKSTTISSTKSAQRSDTGVKTVSATEPLAPLPSTQPTPAAYAQASAVEPSTPRKGLLRSGAREIPASNITTVLKSDCACASTPTTVGNGATMPVQHLQTPSIPPMPSVPAPTTPTTTVQQIQYVPSPQTPGTYAPAPQFPAQPIPVQAMPGTIIQANHVPGAVVPAIPQPSQIPGAVVPAIPQPSSMPPAADNVGAGYLLVPDNSDIAQDQMKKGAVLWDAPPLGGKGAAVAPSAFASPIEKVRSVVDPVIDGQVFYKAQGDLAVPNLPVAISQTVVANVDNIHFGPQNNFQSITGQIFSFKGTWRLRYASVESADPFGGCITLVGEGLDSLKEGQIVRVQGVIMPPTDRTMPHRYQATRVEVLAGQ